jgi:TetR/AcrR family acrAB operon transcriptional repressor
MQVFRRHGFRRSSLEEVAEAAGLTRQALYHHFDSREALFRAVIAHVLEAASEAGLTAAAAAEASGEDLADILAAQITARFARFIASCDGSPHVEELFSEQLIQARDLYREYAARFDAELTATIERARRRQRLVLAGGITAPRLAGLIGMAVNGTKSAYPSMQPPQAFLRELGVMVRTLVAGAVTAAPRTTPKAGFGKTAQKPSARSETGERP